MRACWGPRRSSWSTHHPYRLAFAKEAYGAEAINFDSVEDAAQESIARTGFRGVDASIDAIGSEAKGSAVETALTTLKLEGSSGAALRQAMAATRRGGIVSVPGVYAGFIHAFLFRDAFEKGLTFKGGQTHVQHFMPELLNAIREGRLQPHQIITHAMPPEDAVRGYKIFEEKQEQCRKAIFNAPLRPTFAGRICRARVRRLLASGRRHLADFHQGA